MLDLSADLERIIALDRRTLRNYLVLGFGVILVGVVVIAAGFLAPFEVQEQGDDIQGLIVKLGGIAIGTFSTIPLKQYFDRRERLSAAEMLQLKWRELTAAPGASQGELARVTDLIRKLYEKRVLG